MSTKELDPKELRSMVKALNDTGLLDVKMKVGNKSNEDVSKSFAAGVLEIVGKDKLNDIPDDIINYYNENFASDDDGEDGEDEPTPEPTPEPEKKGKENKETSPAAAKKDPRKKDKPAAEKKEPKEKKEKKEKAEKEHKFTREASIALTLKKVGSISIEDWLKNSDALYVENGGESNADQAQKGVKRIMKYLTALELVEVKDNTVTLL